VFAPPVRHVGMSDERHGRHGESAVASLMVGAR